MKLTHFVIRVRVPRQPGERDGGDPGDERLPGGDEAAQGPAEEIKGRFQTVLRTTTQRERERERDSRIFLPPLAKN